MKALWAFESFHQDKSKVKTMHDLLKQFVSKPEEIEIGYIVTRHELRSHFRGKPSKTHHPWVISLDQT